MAFGKYSLCDLSIIEEVDDDDLGIQAPLAESTTTDGDEIAKRFAELKNLLVERTSEKNKDEKEIVKLREMGVQLKFAAKLMQNDIEEKENRESEKRILKAKTKQRALEVKLAKKMKDIRGVDRLVCNAESVDLAFIIDFTASMSETIDAVHKQIKEVVRRLKVTNSNLSLRVALVAYRGVRNGEEGFNIFDFSPSIDEFDKFLSSITTWGGDGYFANMAGGIEKANNRLSWQQASRTVFLIGDMPCHGKQFWNPEKNYSIKKKQKRSWYVNYEEGTPGVNIIAELQKLQDNVGAGTMTLLFGRLKNSTDTMISAFKEQEIHIEEVKMDDSKNVASAITKGVRNSIFKTLTFSQGKAKSLFLEPISENALSFGDSLFPKSDTVRTRRYTITDPLSDASWKKRPANKVDVYRNKDLTSVDDLKAGFQCMSIC